MPAFAPDLHLTLGLTDEEYRLILQLLSREPTYAELGMFSVQWSEHCSYKCSKKVLSYFKNYKKAIESDGLENAGVVPIGDGLGIVMKIESHNHPSAVEPYQGAATGVGGIIRDIFTMGARPIAALNSLRFGTIDGKTESPEVTDRNHYLFERVVAGIAGYGNCVGVPTVAGEVSFDPRYSGNPLVNAMCVGLVKLDEVTTSGAAGIGNSVIFLGSATGKDGIQGASFASEVLGEDSESKRPNVQIGDPFAEKLLIEATLEALQTGAIQSIQDMGAAGLTCSTTEMSSKGCVGMEINLDLVPMRESDMTAFELLLSESQERMLCVAHAGRDQEVIQVFEKWGLNAVVIGKVTEDQNIKIWRNGKCEVDAPSKAFTDGCPSLDLPIKEPLRYLESADWNPSTLPPIDLSHSLQALMSTPTLASKRWVFQQYDQQVQTQTATVAGKADAAVLAPRGTRCGLAVTVDGNANWVYHDPYLGGQLAVCEAARNVACTGANPIAATDGLNFGNPKDPEVYWQFDGAVKGIAEACEAFDIPVVSGNVSFYNESELGAIPPTPLIGMLGLLSDASNKVEGSFPKHPVEVYALYYSRSCTDQLGLGASSLLCEVFGLREGRPEPPTLRLEKELCLTLEKLAKHNCVACMHDVSEGGLAFALAEMCLENSVGGVFDLIDLSGRNSRLSMTFGEFPGIIILGLEPGQLEVVRSLVPESLVFSRLGKTAEDGRIIMKSDNNDVIQANVVGLKWAYESSISAIMNDIKDQF